MVMLQLVPRVTSWHDLTNVDFHCWPLSASATNAETLATTCTGNIIYTQIFYLLQTLTKVLYNVKEPYYAL